MDGTEVRQDAPAGTLDQRPQSRLIGFVGKGTVTDYEAASLRFIGQSIALLGHTLILVPSKGAADQIREGFELQGGMVRTLEAGVLDVADRTLLYPDPPLLRRLKTAYPDLDNMKNAVIIHEDQIDLWVDAMKEILDDYSIPRP